MSDEPEDEVDETQLALDYMAIDLRIEQWLRHLEEDVLQEYDGIDDTDRTMIIYLMRLSYVQGYKDARNGVVPAEGL